MWAPRSCLRPRDVSDHGCVTFCLSCLPVYGQLGCSPLPLLWTCISISPGPRPQAPRGTTCSLSERLPGCRPAYTRTGHVGGSPCAHPCICVLSGPRPPSPCAVCAVGQKAPGCHSLGSGPPRLTFGFEALCLGRVLLRRRGSLWAPQVLRHLLGPWQRQAACLQGGRAIFLLPAARLLPSPAQTPERAAPHPPCLQVGLALASRALSHSGRYSLSGKPRDSPCPWRLLQIFPEESEGERGRCLPLSPQKQSPGTGSQLWGRTEAFSSEHNPHFLTLGLR